MVLFSSSSTPTFDASFPSLCRGCLLSSGLLSLKKKKKKGGMKEEKPGGLKKEATRRRRCKSLINIESSRFSERDECCRCESVCVCVCASFLCFQLFTVTNEIARISLFARISSRADDKVQIPPT